MRTLRRAAFGSLALTACIGFAGLVGMPLFVQPVGIGTQILRHVLVDCFAFGSLFMLLATLQFSRGSRWVTPLMERLAPKACIVIVGFAIGICVFATVIMALD